MPWVPGPVVTPPPTAVGDDIIGPPPRLDRHRHRPCVAGATTGSTARAARRGGNLARNTLRMVALLRTLPPRWQPRPDLDEGRAAPGVVDPSIGRSGQRAGKHRHGPVHLGSRLLSFEGGTVLVDPGRDEGVRVE